MGKGELAMKRILAISGSRADYGLLEWPVKVLRESFEVQFATLGAKTPQEAFSRSDMRLTEFEPHCILILGDRWEILQAAIAAHLQRIPIAHIGGGDVTLGSYDDAMRDCISRMATYHFATCYESANKLISFDYENVTMIGNIAIDYIRHGDWRRELLLPKPYVVVSYQPETIDGTNEIERLIDELPECERHYIEPNRDRGSDEILAVIKRRIRSCDAIHSGLPRSEFLNLINQCQQFIGNSSAMLYEAPELGVKCRMIGKRQQGRVAPSGDGKASERIREVLCRVL